MTLTTLRDRLAAATGPSRELDWAIEELTLGVKVPVEHRSFVDPYTASIDAAVTLVPPDMLVENLGEMRDSGPLTGYWLAQLCPRGPRKRLPPAPITAASLQSIIDADPCVRARTPALALCLAVANYHLSREASRG